MKESKLPAQYPYFRDGLFCKESVQEQLESEYRASAPEIGALDFSDNDALLRARILEWDSNFFGSKIARLDQFYFETSSCARLLWSKLENWIQERQVSYISVRLNIAQRYSINFLTAHGFEYVNAKYLLRKPLGAEPQFPRDPLPVSLKPFEPVKLDLILDMARDNFTQNRFYADQFFDNEMAKKMYHEWLRNHATSRPEDVWVGYLDSKPIGFVISSDLGLANTNFALITLIAVAPEERQNGYGKVLLELIEEELKKRGVAVVFANVVASNIASLSMFQRKGFLINSTLLEYRQIFVRQ